MKFNKYIFATAAVTLIGISVAQAETVITKTETTQKEIPNVEQVEFKAFDLNGDGTYSTAEVGQKLFKIFDANGDEQIDNIEWDQRHIYTIVPVQVETKEFFDYNDDGVIDEEKTSRETFFEATGLIKFDKNLNGLSAKEFIGVGFEKLDLDENKMISYDEWKSAYTDALKNHEKNENYNK